jgi:hypothetical protein
MQRPCQDKNNLPQNTQQRIVRVVSQTMALCFPPAHSSCVFVFSISSPLPGSIIYTAPNRTFLLPLQPFHTQPSLPSFNIFQLLFISDSTPTNSLSPQQKMCNTITQAFFCGCEDYTHKALCAKFTEGKCRGNRQEHLQLTRPCERCAARYQAEGWTDLARYLRGMMDAGRKVR